MTSGTSGASGTSWTSLTSLVPRAPDFAVDHAALAVALPVMRSFAGVRQDPRHHAEGDVAVHTAMVLDALAGHAAFRALPDDERAAVFLAAALHDVAKPLTTTIDADGVHARGHSKRGAIMARRLLWEAGAPFAARESICGLVRVHQLPFFLADHDDVEAERRAIGASMIARLDHLALVAWADAAGRRCDDQQRLLDNIALFQLRADELGCARAPFRFVDDATRFAFFHDARRTRHDVVTAPQRGPQVVVLAGLPASGKDRWCALHAAGRAVVSLDELRVELDVEHGGPQGAVIDAARARCKDELRAGRGFVWNATSLVRELRRPIVSLAVDYGATVRVVYLEAPPAVLDARNRARATPVPARAIDRMLDKWDVPDATEAHVVEHVVEHSVEAGGSG